MNPETIEYWRDRAVCDQCGHDVAESGEALCECDCVLSEMIPASDLPAALRAMKGQRDEAYAELMMQ